jgi:phage-related baseplate assembly protein
MSAPSLSSLPAVTFATLDPTTVQSTIITTYEDLTDRTLAQADPVRLFLLAIAEIIIQQNNVINNAGQSNLLAYATGAYLDQIGALVNCYREAATGAVTTLQYTISQAQSGILTIPAGYRGSVGTLVFATTEIATIPAGSLTCTVPAQCTAVGTGGNGYLPGEINQVVDTFPFFQAVTNTTTSSGGTNTELDAAFQARIQQAPEAFATCGPEGAYAYWAQTANSDISDVSVTSPTAGSVLITVLMEGGTLPTSDILAEVLAICSADTVRPLTDNVTAAAPTVVTYNINATYYIDPSNAAMATTVQSNVAAAVAAYQAWQCATLGQDVNPSQLIYMMMAAGAKNVNVTSPTFTALTDTEVAQVGTVSVNYGGTD